MKKILFVCVENSNRSQMAEAFAKIHGKGKVEAYSSGSRPSGIINPKAIAAMKELGYDLTTHGSKSLDEIPQIKYDYAITMECSDECPFVQADFNIKITEMESIVKMPHIKFKPTRTIPIDFNPEELNDIEVPEESKIVARKYQKSNQLNDGAILLMFEKNVIFAFDHLNGKEKIVIPEINPVTIFFSNAVMSHRLLIHYKEKLLENSPTVKNFHKDVNPSDFGNFFQFATNIIVNLQATIESLANRIIPKEHEFIGKDNEHFEPSLFHKINTTLPEIKEGKFKTKHEKQNNLIRQLVNLRNEIIHLKPAGEINSAYKEVYRKMINFKYTEAIQAVRTFVDYYEQGLIEECACQKEFYYSMSSVE